LTSQATPCARHSLQGPEQFTRSFVMSDDGNRQALTTGGPVLSPLSSFFPSINRDGAIYGRSENSRDTLSPSHGCQIETRGEYGIANSKSETPVELRLDSVVNRAIADYPLGMFRLPPIRAKMDGSSDFRVTVMPTVSESICSDFFEAHSPRDLHLAWDPPMDQRQICSDWLQGKDRLPLANINQGHTDGSTASPRQHLMCIWVLLS